MTPIFHSGTAAMIRHLMGSTAIVIAGLALSAPAQAQSLPTGGSVSTGTATISQGPGSVTVNQGSQNVAINWNTFNIAQGNNVEFVQPNSSSIALNRVLGADPSVILGSLNANGRVFLINPNGVIFGQGSQVNVSGLIASTLDMSDADLNAGRYRFSGASSAAVLNQGAITAGDSGFVALLGANVSNQGLIQARLGTVALAAGEAITLDVAGDGLLNVSVDTGAVNALVSNGGMIRADGGHVLLTAQAAGQLLRTAVNNTGVIEARTIENRGGSIILLADMHSGTVTLDGTLDASAPNGGDGGFVETSAANVNVAASARVSTAAATGKIGTWLIDPQDFIIGPAGNISGATLSAMLVTNNVTITTLTGPDATVPGAPPTTTLNTATPGNGDIFVNEPIAWVASSNATTLTFLAERDVNINAAITATNGNVVACCGRDINVNAPVTTTNGSILLNAGRNVNVFHVLTTTDGNIALCAGHDVHIQAAITLTRGTTIPAQSLGLAPGLVIIAGADGTGPGTEGGTLIFAPLTPPVTVTVAPVQIAYNPPSYSAPTDYGDHFILTEGASLTQRMLLFPDGDRPFDGTTATTLDGFRTTVASGLPVGVTLIAGPNAFANFDSPGEGTGIGITYGGYTLGGPNADQYALAGSCCAATFRTQGTITPAPVVVPTPTPTPTPVPTPTPTPVPTPTPTPVPTPTPTPVPTPTPTPVPTPTPTPVPTPTPTPVPTPTPTPVPTPTPTPVPTPTPTPVPTPTPTPVPTPTPTPVPTPTPTPVPTPTPTPVPTPTPTPTPTSTPAPPANPREDVIVPTQFVAAGPVPEVLNFAVVDEGLLMPTSQLETTAPVVEAPVPVAPRPAAAPRPFAPVHYPPKQDRN